MTEFKDPNIADQIRPFLRAGLWIASLLLAAGLVQALTGTSDRRLIVAGLGALVALPVVNVAIGFIDEVRLRQWRFAVAAGAVMLIILLNALYMR